MCVRTVPGGGGDFPLRACGDRGALRRGGGSPGPRQRMLGGAGTNGRTAIQRTRGLQDRQQTLLWEPFYPDGDREYPRRGIGPWWPAWRVTRRWPSTAGDMVGRENIYSPKTQLNLYLTRKRRKENNTVSPPQTADPNSTKLTSFTNEVNYLLKKF